MLENLQWEQLENNFDKTKKSAINVIFKNIWRTKT